MARVGLAGLLAGAATAWVLATEHAAPIPAAAVVVRDAPRWPLTPARARTLRDDALRRAQVRRSGAASPAFDLGVIEPPFACRFMADTPTGTSPKFDCIIDTGEVVKVKYGRNPEIASEVAAARLLAALGYPVDRMTIAPRVRCDGCPRSPFVAMRLLQLTGLHGRYPTYGSSAGYSEFEWVAVERKFAAAVIEAPDQKGWAWWELERVDPALGAHRGELDALRLLAVFLAHWDNKSENQRLVCLDPPGPHDMPCTRPLAMLQDLGATFGPEKANLASWRHTPVWSDRASCLVSMESMPWRGGTFPEARISEGGRSQLAAQLTQIEDEEIRGLFRAARFPEHYGGTDDEKDLDAWTDAFRRRVDQIVKTGPCPP